MFQRRNAGGAKTAAICGALAVGYLFSANGAQAAPAQRLQLCVGVPTGKIVAKKRCGTSEVVLDAETLNALITTIEGQPGKAGPQGPQGMKGEKGESGLAGAMGPQGLQGPQGLKGDKGDKGDGGAQGAQGVQGSQGPQGVQGVQGPNGVAGYELQTAKLVIDPGASIVQEAYCSDGKVVVGGGAQALRNASDMYLHASLPFERSGRYGWVSRFVNRSKERAGFEVWAICITAH